MRCVVQKNINAIEDFTLVVLKFVGCSTKVSDAAAVI